LNDAFGETTRQPAFRVIRGLFRAVNYAHGLKLPQSTTTRKIGLTMPFRARPLLLRVLAYQIQVAALGGPDKATLRVIRHGAMGEGRRLWGFGERSSSNRQSRRPPLPKRKK